MVSISLQQCGYWCSMRGDRDDNDGFRCSLLDCRRDERYPMHAWYPPSTGHSVHNRRTTVYTSAHMMHTQTDTIAMTKGCPAAATWALHGTPSKQRWFCCVGRLRDASCIVERGAVKLVMMVEEPPFLRSRCTRCCTDRGAADACARPDFFFVF